MKRTAMLVVMFSLYAIVACCAEPAGKPPVESALWAYVTYSNPTVKESVNIAPDTDTALSEVRTKKIDLETFRSSRVVEYSI